MSEFEKQDAEVIGMVNTAIAKRRAEEERRRAEEAALDAEYVQAGKRLHIHTVLPYVAMAILAVVTLLLGQMI